MISGDGSDRGLRVERNIHIGDRRDTVADSHDTVADIDHGELDRLHLVSRQNYPYLIGRVNLILEVCYLVFGDTAHETGENKGQSIGKTIKDAIVKVLFMSDTIVCSTLAHSSSFART